ncbi:hypothetical protein FC682_25955 [Peribacillus simplex]|uniref:hypothetical protein n=1 Tax=Peribacillus simplex TaxID=1478 RepID=UPI0010BEB86A|nr:hypothetical protein [Peribacillus simplex]TKG98975.1 hypothetical protein FC682_25955 [Peribacillus simplex]
MYIGKLRANNFNNKVILSQYTDGENGSDFSIGEFFSINSGLAGSSLIYLDYFQKRWACSIEHLVVRDCRVTKLNKIIEYSDDTTMHNFKVSKLHNLDNLPVYGTQYGNFSAYFKFSRSRQREIGCYGISESRR